MKENKSETEKERGKARQTGRRQRGERVVRETKEKLSRSRRSQTPNERHAQSKIEHAKVRVPSPTSQSC